ncbi:MAG: hypothetical protein MMC33_005950 [Icmadophila ericetorum]|nr:hypothetical protein [Icmadophila ericetorum]
MGPRKKAKPNPPADIEPDRPQSTPLADTGKLSSLPLAADPKPKDVAGDINVDSYLQQTQNNVTTNRTSHDGAQAAATSTTKDEVVDQQEPPSAKSWFNGTWSRMPKSSAVTQIWKDNVSTNAKSTGRSSPSRLPLPMQDDIRSEVSPTPGVAKRVSSRASSRTSSMHLRRSLASSTRSLPLSATTTKVNVSSNTANSLTHDREPVPELQNQNSIKETDDTTSIRTIGPDSPSFQNNNKQKSATKKLSPQTIEESINQVSPASTIWLSWLSRGDPARSATVDSPALPKEDGEMHAPAVKQLQHADKDAHHGPESTIISHTSNDQPTRSWLGLLRPSVDRSNVRSIPSETVETDQNPQVMDRTDDVPTPSMTPAQETPTISSWKFWPRNTVSATKNEIPGTSSCAAPNNRSTLSLQSSSVGKDDIVAQNSLPVSTTEGLSQLSNVRDSSQPSTVTSAKPNSSAKAAATVSPEITTPKIATTQSNVNDLIVPSLRETYKYADSPGFLQQLSRLLNYGRYTPPKHVGILRDPQRIKKALAIGVHGYFPAPLIRTVLGQPTGTSIKFAELAANAIGQWTKDQGYTCEVVKIALEGEGKISERVDLLWKLMLNWTNAIREADFILLACHSQGVPVAVMLTEKLISLGFLNRARIGVCAMAGINLGPFIDYKSRWISGSAGELFDFARADSQVSKAYEVALKVALDFGTKIVYTGSINDQLVSLESSTFGTINHPYIYRAVFVDGKVHAPDFLIHLVAFTLKLRNLGISDHGLIRELSAPLAGSWNGEGHSRIYENPSVYRLAIEHALETTELDKVPLQVKRPNLINPQNPYILPFAVRGVLEEKLVQTELHGETIELLKEFDHWKPATKALKDVKFRLEGIRSKL